MPRHHHAPDPERLLTMQERAILHVLWQELNVIRVELGMAARTVEERTVLLRQAMYAQPQEQP